MNATKRKRIALRIFAMICMTLLLAVLPPLALKSLVLNAFYMTDDAERIATQYQDTLKWCHMAGIAALFFVNLGFFSANEKRGDSGPSLRGRNALQAWLNFFTILIGVLAMVVLRFSIESDTLIDNYLSRAPLYVASMLSPYYVFVITGVWFGSFCMRGAPATNCEVRDPLMRKIDDNIKLKAQTRT